MQQMCEIFRPNCWFDDKSMTFGTQDIPLGRFFEIGPSHICPMVAVAAILQNGGHN